MATVLIIGASKGIGLATVNAALKASHSVRALSRYPRHRSAYIIPSLRSWMAMRSTGTRSSGRLWASTPSFRRWAYRRRLT